VISLMLMGLATWNEDPAIAATSRLSRRTVGNFSKPNIAEARKTQDTVSIIAEGAAVECLSEMRNSGCRRKTVVKPRTRTGRKFGGERWQKYGGRNKRWTCFPQPSEILDTENHQPHDHNSLPPTSVFPFPVHHFNSAFDTLF
jgi:hypothetical protein